MAAVNVTFPGNLGQVDTLADLRSLPIDKIAPSIIYIVKGRKGIFAFDPGSLAPDDGDVIIKPAELTPLQAGRWIFEVNAFAPGANGQDGTPGEPGMSNNTLSALSELAAFNPGNGSATILETGGTYTFRQGDYSTQIDGVDYVGSSFTPATAGAWVRTYDVPTTQRQYGYASAGLGVGRGMWAYLLDSLTDGAYGSSYRKYLDGLLRGQFGDGGPGYQGFGAGVANDTGAGFFKTDDFLYIDIATPIYGGLSVDGRGLYAAAATGGASFNWSPASRWKTARIFYEAGPGMGTIKYKFSTQPDAQAIDLDCSVGAGLKFITVTYGGDDQPAVVFFNGSGKLVFYGGDWVLDPAGYRPGNFAQGGRTLQSVAAQDSTRRRLWWSLLSPVRALLDGGMNDRMTRTPAQHYADWSVIVADIQAAVPACGIVMIQSLEPADAATTFFRQYTAQKLRVARERDTAFYDLRHDMGYYQAAVAAGFMTEDRVHPSDRGNRGKAQYYARQLGVPVSGSDPGRTAWASTGGDAAPPSPFGTLTAKPQIQATGGQRRELYRLGLTNGYSTGNFSFRVAGQRQGTSAVYIVEVQVTLTSANVVNEAYLADGQTATPAPRVIQRTLAGDGQTIELPVNVTIVGNQASIGVTPSFNGVLNVSAEYELLNFYPVGQLVFENATA